MKKTLTAMMLAMTAMAYAQTDTMKTTDDMAQQTESQIAKKPMMQDDMAKKEMKDTMHKDGMMKDKMKDDSIKKHKKAKNHK